MLHAPSSTPASPAVPERARRRRTALAVRVVTVLTALAALAAAAQAGPAAEDGVRPRAAAPVAAADRAPAPPASLRVPERRATRARAPRAPRSDVGTWACRSGRVALTFDDGPSATVTPRLVRVLRRLDVPATFFMVGSRVSEAPAAARLVARSGFTIGNHTEDHADLTALSPAQVRAELWATSKALRRAGVTPSRLVRPPYGATNARVERVIRGLGLVSVLWNVDSRDWTGLPTRRITGGVLGQVRAHGRDGSVVLQHDGVENSPATLAAVPREVRRLRARGYCFVALDARGEPAPLSR